MKKTIISLALIAALLTACAQGQIHFADLADVEKALTESSALAAAQQLTTTKSTAHAKPSAPAKKETEPDNEAPAEPDMAQPGESTQPEQRPAPRRSRPPNRPRHPPRHRSQNPRRSLCRFLRPTPRPPRQMAQSHSALQPAPTAGGRSMRPTQPIGRCRSRSTPCGRQAACPPLRWMTGCPRLRAAGANPSLQAGRSTIRAW